MFMKTYILISAILFLSLTSSNLNSQTAEEYFKMGYKEDMAGNFEKAVEYYTESLKLAPESANAFYNRGKVYALGLKNYKAALQDFTKAIEINPSFAEAYCNRGLTFDKLKEYNSAIADFEKALEINPNLFQAYNGRGSVYFYLKKYQEAIPDFSTILTTPGFPKVVHCHISLFFTPSRHD